MAASLGASLLGDSPCVVVLSPAWGRVGRLLVLPAVNALLAAVLSGASVGTGCALSGRPLPPVALSCLCAELQGARPSVSTLILTSAICICVFVELHATTPWKSAFSCLTHVIREDARLQAAEGQRGPRRLSTCLRNLSRPHFPV